MAEQLHEEYSLLGCDAMWLLQEVTFLSLAVPIFSQISRTMA
jgi:hypothetical protein